MAKRSQEVLNRVNTLNSNLENANISEIEKNISSRLFNVLDGANSISVDSELYASIDGVSNALDITAGIARITLNPVLNINGVNIIDTGNLPHATVAQTQTSIDRITQSENNLTTLESNATNGIEKIRARFEENVQSLGNIRDEQNIFTGPARGLAMINPEIHNEEGLQTRINRLLNILSSIRNELAGPARAAILNGYFNDFTTASKTGISTILTRAGVTTSRADLGSISNINDINEINNKLTDYSTILTNVEGRLNTLTHERNLRTHINGLKSTQINIPNGFLPFTSAQTVASPGATAADTDTYITDFNNRITQINNLQTEILNIRARYTEHKNRLNRILQLQRLQERLNTTHPEATTRQEEFQAISDISYNNLLLGPTVVGRARPAGTYQVNLPNTTTPLGCTTTAIPLNFIHGTALVRPGHFNYTLCDSDGNPLRTNGGNFEYQNGTQTISIGGITFQNNNITTQTMTLNNLQINPVEGISFPLNLDLNVRVRIHDNATGLDIDHHKPIHLEITAPTLPQTPLNPGDPSRETAYDSLVPPMDDRIIAEYTDRYRENLENEAIWRILREGGNEAEVNEIYNNEARRELFINRIRTRLRGYFPFLAIGDLQTGFRTDMTRENRNVPVQHLLNQNAFQNYVRQSIPNNLRDYASGQINRNANFHRDDILQEFLDFQSDIVNNRVDNNDNLAALAQVPADNNGPQGHPNNFFQRLRRDRNIKNNYTKFFQGREAEFDNLSLETEDGTINYSVHVEVPGVNKIVATINIDGKDEPEIIEASSHDRLIRGILTRGGTKDGEPLNRKLRCNIALSVLKAMVAMSPQRLNRQIPVHAFRDNRGNNVDCDRVEAYIRGGNLRIRASNPARQNVTIFDEEQFKNIHDVDMLENGIHDLSTQINIIMNATAQEYDEATSAMARNLRNRYVMQYDTAQRLRGGPIKRLRGRMIHGRTNYDFDFDTAVNEAGKSVNISLDKGLFTVSGDFDGQHYEYRGRNLGSILRKKINRKRVFDGIELAMLATINENFIQRLRENHRVQTENFVISDSNLGKTGRTYIFDASGDLSYMEIEDNNLNPLGAGQSGRIDPLQVPTHRIRCNEAERREFMQNPLLAGRLQREMRRRLAMF